MTLACGVTRQGVEVPKDGTDARVLALVRRELHVAPVSLSDPFPKKFTVFLETPAKYVVPLHWARKALEPWGATFHERRSSRGADADLRFAGALRPELRQPEAAAAVIASWKACGGAMLCLPVGFGKTLTALYLAARVRKKTLVLVHKAFLKDQWVERVREFLPGATTSAIQGDVCDTSGDVVVAMIQTLLSRKYDVSVFEPFGCVIADECFPYRQPVLTGDGPREIGKVYNDWRAGKDVRVQSFDEATGAFSLRRVTHAWEKTADHLVRVAYSKSAFECTPSHLALTTEGWMEAASLRAGNLLVSKYSDAADLAEEAVARAMNPDQYQVLLGSLLGDGHLQTLPSGRYRLGVTHGVGQREYCSWKADMFGVSVREFAGGCENGTELEFVTHVIDLPADQSFPSKKTFCPQWVLDGLDARSLAVWHMDGGSLQPCGSITLATNSFDEESHVRICTKLQSMGLEARYGVVATRPDGRTFFEVKLGQEAGRKMVAMIARYIHPSMRYKVANARAAERCDLERETFQSTDFCAEWTVNGLRYLRRDCPARPGPSARDACAYAWDNEFLGYGTLRVSSVELVEIADKRVYDLEVEGTHTFVCTSAGGSGPVVHNCHHVGAAAFSQAMWGQCAPYTLGLSATPARKDGLTRVVEWFVGPVAFHIRRENQDTTRVRVVRYACPAFDAPPPVNRRGDVCFASVITRLVENEHRTRRVAAEAAALHAQGRDVLVLTHRRRHVADLAAAIRAAGVADCGTYVGGDKACPDTKVIVATYALTSEGFDLPRLDALVLATPASDVEQSCGRVMRGSSTRGAVIVDVADQWGVCFAQFAKRRAYYRRTGFAMGGGDDDGPAADAGADAAAAAPRAFAFVDDDED
jgi:superfamily II DNA or RNA helicase